MGVKRQWKVMKLRSLSINEDIRKQLIHDIISRKNPTISLYAWDVKDGIAEEAFFAQRDALRDWYLKNRKWESETESPGVLIHHWKVDANQLLKHVSSGQVRNAPLAENTDVDVAVVPSSLQLDMQRTLIKHDKPCKTSL